jgi:hypothetical protein
MKKYIRKRIYAWHRITSLVVCIPVLLWTVSGFLHPVMNGFRPRLMNQSLAHSIIDTAKIKIPLHQALSLHNISEINNFRIVELYGAHYYQLQLPGKDTACYISCFNGQMLLSGDQQYAAYLAQKYLSDPHAGSKNGHHGAPADLASIVSREKGMSMRSNTNIIDVSLVNRFDNEYKSSNVLLPVQRVSFDRDDNLRLYIETSTGRLSVAMNDSRAWFTRFFALTHSWSFMNGWGAAKHIIIALLSFTCLLTSVFGFVVYNILKKKQATAGSSRRAHRVLGNIFMVTTLLYAFSGGWHSLQKLSKKEEKINQVKDVFNAAELRLPFTGIMKKSPKDSLVNISIVRYENEKYWQVTVASRKKISRKYLNTTDLKPLPGGDETYGRYLAAGLSGKPAKEIRHSRQVNKFNDHYSMMKKRLPVVEVGMSDGNNYYVETSTGHLAAIAGASDAAERFSFSNLHMHHYWEDLFGKANGKKFKNLFLVATTLGLLLLAMTGMIMYWRKRKKARQAAN